MIHLTQAQYDELQAAKAEAERMAGLVYVPGLWHCAKCKFTLIQATLHATNGAVTARDEPGSTCPNCSVTLWRVSERDHRIQLQDDLERTFLELQDVKAERDRLRTIIDTPELVDFPKAVHLEAVHQEVRWGSEDREGKEPPAWFWLLSHLATRALEHHKEAERLEALAAPARERAGEYPGLKHVADGFDRQISHHREKAAHHCITSAAVLAHWHASVIGKHTAMRPGIADPTVSPTTTEGAPA